MNLSNPPSEEVVVTFVSELVAGNEIVLVPLS